MSKKVQLEEMLMAGRRYWMTLKLKGGGLKKTELTFAIPEKVEDYVMEWMMKEKGERRPNIEVIANYAEMHLLMILDYILKCLGVDVRYSFKESRI